MSRKFFFVCVGVGVYFILVIMVWSLFVHESIVYLHNLSNFNLIDELHVYELKSSFGYMIHS